MNTNTAAHYKAERDEAVADAAICISNQAKLQARLDEAVALLDSALRTINAIATTAGYAYRASNAARTSALDDIRMTAGTFKGSDGHKADAFLARIDGAAARR